MLQVGVTAPTFSSIHMLSYDGTCFSWTGPEHRAWRLPRYPSTMCPNMWFIIVVKVCQSSPQQQHDFELISSPCKSVLVDGWNQLLPNSLVLTFQSFLSFSRRIGWPNRDSCRAQHMWSWQKPTKRVKEAKSWHVLTEYTALTHTREGVGLLLLALSQAMFSLNTLLQHTQEKEYSS